MAQATPLSDPKAQKLFEMIKDINIAMLTTHDGGHLRSRPMWIIPDNGRLSFFTRLSAHKTDEIEANHQVNLSFADPKAQNYVSVSGHARLTRDPGRVAKLWSEPMRTWFPEGKDDPDLAVVDIEIEAAEYWDAPSSAMVHLYGYVKAAVTGKPPHPDDNAKLGPISGRH
ncbi:MAG TPA: pyridoxamine 5'-phosphate oxidase family protein [Azospirillaceae bacterium]|nr:pyridoxamine 5'-phosphate oxidase family protein [Azospirillaceae bacterium]